MTNLTISTWNIGSLHDGPHYDRNLNYLRSVLTEHPTDILCLQECPHDPELLQQLKTWTGLTNALYFITSESHIDLQHDMGLLILSRLPVTDLRQVKPDKPQVEAWHKGNREYWHEKLFVAVKCAYNDNPLTVVTGHGFPFHRYGLDDGAHDDVIAPSFTRIDQWIEELRKEFPNTLFCFAADFNYGEPLRFMPRLREAFADAFDGEATRPSGRKTDAILLPREYHPESECNVVAPLDEKGRGWFDHNYISATYSL